MAERRENSVLFSLRELRKIEDDRVKQEQDDAQRRDQEAKDRVLAEERRAREEIENQRRAVAAEERARADEEQRRLREEDLRLQEAERKHRVEAQMKLEEQRLKMEIDARANVAAAKKPKGLIFASIGLLLLVAGLGVFLYLQKQEQEKKDQDALIAQAAQKRAFDDLQRSTTDELNTLQRLKDENTALLAKLNDTHDEQQRKKVQDEIAANNAATAEHTDKLKNLRDRGGSHVAPTEPKAPSTVIVDKTKCKDPNDPLCGI